MPLQTFDQDRQCCLTVLVLAFLAGSGVWLKLILSDVLAYNLQYDLLYEREYLKPSVWAVARGLNISADLSNCERKHAPKPGRQLVDSYDNFATVAVGAEQASDLLGTGGALTFALANGASPPPPSSPLAAPPSPPVNGTTLPPFPPSPQAAAPVVAPINKCQVDSVRIWVNATLALAEEPIGPLYFKMYFSQDWEKWTQASIMDVEDDLFTIDRSDFNGTHSQLMGGVTTYACLAAPSFNYIMGCVVEGYKPGKLGDAGEPPFDTCVAVSGICGATCNSGVEEPTYYDPSLPGYHKSKEMHCVSADEPYPTLPLSGGEDLDSFEAIERWAKMPRYPPNPNDMGIIRLDDIERKGLGKLGLYPASYFFSVMYVMGVLSLFLMYVPAIGQREGVAPTWNRLKSTLTKATVRLGDPQEAHELLTMRRRSRSRRTTGRSSTSALITDASTAPLPHAPVPHPSGGLNGTVTTNSAPLLNGVLATSASHASWYEGHAAERGLVPVASSISATESANIILRNGLGKIAANLRLLVEVGESCETRMTVVDLFIDEGHRLGAYYLYKSLALAFYVCIPKHHALKVASSWLKKMNEHEGASSTDKFDGLKLFTPDFIDEKTRNRSEIRLLELVHGMQKALNHFTVEVNLFDKILEMPILDPAKQSSATQMLASMPTIHEDPEELDRTINDDDNGDGATTPQSDRPLSQSSLPRVNSLDHIHDDDVSSIASEDVRDDDEAKAQDYFRERYGFAKDVPLDAFTKLLCDASKRTATLKPRPITLKHVLEVLIRDQELSQLEGGLRDSARPAMPAMHELSFFHPLLWQKLGALIMHGYEGTFESKGDRQVPSDVAAYSQSLVELGKNCGDAVLDSVAWINMRPQFKSEERALLKAATSTKHVAFDMVLDVLEEYSAKPHASNPVPRVLAIYCARANPTKWQPWTKPNHRRIVKPGVWINAKPTTRPPIPPTMVPEAVEARFKAAQEYWQSRKRVGLLLGTRTSAYFYEDDDEIDDMPEPEPIQTKDYKCLNTHIGKAGGLNFGLHAVTMILAERREPPPSLSNPLIFSIVDARHTTDQRWWLHTITAFFFADEHSNVTFQNEIALVQVAHNYLGLSNSNDYLDMRNDFLFTGMAVIRNQSYGMTSCGTGGIWAVTHTDKLEDFFFGRTMIEDTASSIAEFVKGRKAVYVAPFASKPSEAQLMCAVPKVSETYLEALERWDTGAIQCLCSMAINHVWFWIALPIALSVMALVVVPSWFPLGDIAMIRSWEDVEHLFSGPTSCPSCFWLDRTTGKIDYPLMVILVALLGWTCIFSIVFVLSRFFPRKLNFCMRMCVLYFNVTYPINSVASIFWIAIPPWICIGGRFPFRFNPVFAIIGSLLLRVVEWAIVLKAKKEGERAGTHLHEYSIFRSQQMNEVTVPIKLRAVVLGFISAYKDAFLYHDNSFWISFGTAEAVVWVQAWLCLCMLAMVGAFVGGITNLIIYWNDPNLHDTVLAACCFGMVLAAIQLWILWEPTWFVMRGRKLKISLRHTEVLVLILIGVGVVVITQGHVGSFRAFQTI